MPKPLQSYHHAWLDAHPSRTEAWLRDRLRDGFHIHHVDGDHANDAPENLLLIDSSDHLGLHGMNLRALARRNLSISRQRRRCETATQPVGAVLPGLEAVDADHATGSDPRRKMTGARLRELLKQLGWSSATLAAMTQTHVNTVSKWMTGRAKVPGGVVAYVQLAAQVKAIDL